MIAPDATAAAVDLEQAFRPSRAQLRRQMWRSAGIWALFGAVLAAALQPPLALALVLGMLLNGWIASASGSSILQEGELRALLARLRCVDAV